MVVGFLGVWFLPPFDHPRHLKSGEIFFLSIIDFFTSERNFSAKIEGIEKAPNEWKQKTAAASYHPRIWADGYREAANHKPWFAV